MPIFEYRCTSCGRIFEEILSEYKAEVPCVCGKGVGKKMLSAFAVGKQSATPCGAGESECGMGGDTGGSVCGSCCGHNHH